MYVNTTGERFPCPCCGYLVYSSRPGSYQECPICGWTDNLAQLRFPLMPNGSNDVSLVQGQKNFIAVGAAEKRRVGEVRKPYDDEPRDRQWRVIDEGRDNIEEPRRGIDYANSYPIMDTTVMYYWRDTYWRKLNA